MSRMVVVLGMHRSGTSLLSAALECLGVEYGDRLIAPRSDNPKGFWEDEDIIALNDELYGVLGGFSSSLGFDEQLLLSMPQCAELQVRLAQLLEQRLQAHSVFGIKDPRMPRLMGVWAPILEAQSDAVDYVIPLRNPLSVAASLKARDGFPDAKCLLLWYEHMYRTLPFALSGRAIVIDYDDLIDSPRPVLSKIATRIGLAVDQVALDRFMNEVVEHELRHSEFVVADLEAHPDSFPALVRLYVLLRDLVEGKCFDSGGGALAKVIEDFQSLWPLLRHCGRQDIELWTNWQSRLAENKCAELGQEELRSKVAALECSASEREAAWSLEHDRFENELAGLGTMLAERESALSWYRSERERLEEQGLELSMQLAEARRIGACCRILRDSLVIFLTSPLRRLRRIWQRGGERN